MSREAFEGWMKSKGCDVAKTDCNDPIYFSRDVQGCWLTWNARQPEIDALKNDLECTEIGMHRANKMADDLIMENAALKAEVERLRNAAKPVIDYWFEDDQNRTHDDDNKAFLELSNAYYRRAAMKEPK